MCPVKVTNWTFRCHLPYKPCLNTEFLHIWPESFLLLTSRSQPPLPLTNSSWITALISPGERAIERNCWWLTIMEDFHSSREPWELVNPAKSVLGWPRMKNTRRHSSVQNQTHPWAQRAAELGERWYGCLLVGLSMNCGRSATHGAASRSVGQAATHNYPTLKRKRLDGTKPCKPVIYIKGETRENEMKSLLCCAEYSMYEGERERDTVGGRNYWHTYSTCTRDGGWDTVCFLFHVI